MSKKTRRELLPIRAVYCELQGYLVDYFKTCVGEGKNKPCEHYLGSYLCGYTKAEP